MPSYYPSSKSPGAPKLVRVRVRVRPRAAPYGRGPCSGSGSAVGDAILLDSGSSAVMVYNIGDCRRVLVLQIHPP